MTLLIQYYYNYFLDESKDGYKLLCSSVCLKLMNELYKKFMKEGIDSIESLPKEKKEKFWEHSGKYYQDKEKRIEAVKTAYVLQLITSTE
mgnify:CR=1 FL=1